MAPAPRRRDCAIVQVSEPAIERNRTVEVITVGLDLAKSIFHLYGITEDGEVAFNRPLRRDQVLAFVERLSHGWLGWKRVRPAIIGDVNSRNLGTPCVSCRRCRGHLRGDDPSDDAVCPDQVQGAVGAFCLWSIRASRYRVPFSKEGFSFPSLASTVSAAPARLVY